jgi:hypothetical protein
LEVLNGVFGAMERKARGYRSNECMITIAKCVVAWLAMPSIPSHSK